jgi:AraC-like DNA-binding protein
MQLFLLAWEISRPAANDDLTTRRSRRRDEAVAALHEWFAHHLSRPLKLEDAAAHFHASPRQLLRMLKEASGFGFTDHLVLHRLLQAREWLMTRARASVSEVAAGVGFTSREAFIRRFRATFGLPPLQFRKQWESASDHPGVLPTVTRFLGRAPVLWFKILPATPPQPDPHARPHTLVISNALETIVEIFAIGPTGQRTREAVLERGAMHAIHHDRAGSQWAAVRTATGQQAIFVTPADHCLAIIEPTCFG